MNYQISRTVDAFGRVVLPAEFRNALKLQDRDSIDIYLDDMKGTLTLRKTIPVCCICGKTDSLIHIKKHKK